VIHIVFLIPTLDQIGGAESQVVLLATGLARRGWRVTLITLSGGASSGYESLCEDPRQRCRQRLLEAGVTVLSLRMRKGLIDPSGWLRYRTWARDNSVTIVHAHLLHAVWFARFVRLLIPVPVVLETIHTTRAIHGRDRVVIRLSNWLSNRTTCVSESVAQSVRDSLAIPAHKLTLLPNGIQLDPEWTETLERRDELCQRSHVFHWLAVGRLSPVKDYPTLLRAFAMVLRQSVGHREAIPQLTIAGEGPDEDALRRLAQDLRIAQHIRFAGFQFDVQPLLAAADAFVLSSLWEGLPIGVLEAQAAGLPVVATNGPGTGHALIDGQTGFLVTVGDVSLLAQTMMRVMVMPCCQRRHMGRLGQTFIADRYSIDMILNQWENLYRELLIEQPLPSRHAYQGFRQRVSAEVSKPSSASAFVPRGIDRTVDIRLQASQQERVEHK
jgi:glycosyltransferase involved in cell wall biosynthesis